MIGDSLTPNMQVADWFGVRGIGSVHHSEALRCTGDRGPAGGRAGGCALGTYDVVLSGAVDLRATSLPVVDAPGCFRRDFPLLRDAALHPQGLRPRLRSPV